MRSFRRSTARVAVMAIVLSGITLAMSAAPAHAHKLCGSSRTYSVKIPTWPDERVTLRACIYEEAANIRARVEGTWEWGSNFCAPQCHDYVGVFVLLYKGGSSPYTRTCNITSLINYITPSDVNFSCDFAVAKGTGISHAAGYIKDDVNNDGRSFYYYDANPSPYHAG